MIVSHLKNIAFQPIIKTIAYAYFALLGKTVVYIVNRNYMSA